jgi:EmrB/QacA subfamily drug resistance transporter
LFKPFTSIIVTQTPTDHCNVNAARYSSQTSASKRKLAVTGVMLVIFLFAIDATIVSTAMPTIVAKLGGLELYSWVFSIYMLTSALTTPIFGKLADLFSRRRLMLIGIAIFVAGSTLCGAAQSMEMLVLFRAVQGLGGGAIYALAFIVIGLLYPAEKRAKMQGVISSIWGLASILGPLAGGLIVEHADWRWAFFVNLPITAVAVALIVIGLKEEKLEGHKPALDLKGTGTLLLALLLLFFALAKSAESLHPLNGETFGIIGIAVLLLILFLFIERHADEPIIPLDLFHLSLFRTSAAISALASMGAFGAISYLPLYLQGVIGVTASRAGMVLLFVSMGWTVGSLLAGQGINRLGYRITSVIGMLLLATGYGFFVFAGERIDVAWVLVSGTLIGIGMGLANLTTLVAAQNSVWQQRIGVATSTIMLFRTFGGAFAVSLMGTVLLHQMQAGLNQLARTTTGTLSSTLLDKLGQPQNLLAPATRALVPPDLLPKLITTLADAIWYAFATTFALMVLGIIVSFSIGNYRPVNTPKPAKSADS